MGWVEPVENLSASYVIYKEGNTIHAKANFTGGYNFKGKNAREIIQKAIDNLSSGKIFIRAGLYDNISPSIVTKTDIIIQGEGRDTILKAANALNDAVIETLASATEHEGVVIRDLSIDGNKANQGAPNGTHTDGINLLDCNDFIIENVYIHDVRQFGIEVLGWSGAPIGGHIAHFLIEDCGWNGINVGGSGGHQDRTVVNDGIIRRCSDVGLTIYGDNNVISSVVAEGCQGSIGEGSANSGWGFGVEAGDYNQFVGCMAYDCDEGINFGSGSHNFVKDFTANEIDEVGVYFYVVGHGYDLTIIEAQKALRINGDYSTVDGVFILTATQHGDWSESALIEADYVHLRNGYLLDTGGEDNDCGIRVAGAQRTLIQNFSFINMDWTCIKIESDSNHTRVLNSHFSGGIGILIQDANCDNTWIDGNFFSGVTTDVSDGGTNTSYGHNLDQDGNWDEGVEP